MDTTNNKIIQRLSYSDYAKKKLPDDKLQENKIGEQNPSQVADKIPSVQLKYPPGLSVAPIDALDSSESLGVQSPHTFNRKVYAFIDDANSPKLQLQLQQQQQQSKEEAEDNYRKNVICANCGIKGHIVRDCKEPITSFGIIAFKVVNSPEEEIGDTNEEIDKITDTLPTIKSSSKLLPVYPKIKFLMIQRKDTMGYIDLIRGKYSSTNEAEKWKKIKVCLNEMTFEEKENLKTLDFDTIWGNLWINHSSRCFKNEYELAKKKYSQLDLPTLINNSHTEYTYSEFSFAKGRRNMKESNIFCAEREFKEETCYTKKSYEFINNYPIIQEEFTGTNDVRYRHTYYLVKMKNPVPHPKIDITNKLQTGEVKNIGWFTFEHCKALIRPYDIAKKNVLEKVYSDILKMNFKFQCSDYFKIPNSWNRNYNNNNYNFTPYNTYSRSW
jgi:8-oxo-dGTP pyrophosphatase MutT (NUDIX family)